MRNPNSRFSPYNRRSNLNPHRQHKDQFENEVFRVANSDFANSQQNLDLLLCNCEKTDLEKKYCFAKCLLPHGSSVSSGICRYKKN